MVLVLWGREACPGSDHKGGAGLGVVRRATSVARRWVWRLGSLGGRWVGARFGLTWVPSAASAGRGGQVHCASSSLPTPGSVVGENLPHQEFKAAATHVKPNRTRTTTRAPWANVRHATGERETCEGDEVAGALSWATQSLGDEVARSGGLGGRPPNMIADDVAKVRSTEHTTPEEVAEVWSPPMTATPPLEYPAGPGCASPRAHSHLAW